MGRVVAIDGPSGAGKSTVSKTIAERLGFQYLDTGALYRAADCFTHGFDVGNVLFYDGVGWKRFDCVAFYAIT